MRGHHFLLAGKFGDVSLTAWWPLRALLLAAAILVMAAVVWRGRRWWSRAALALALVVLLPLNVLTAVNAHYGYYLTLSQAFGSAPTDNASLAALRTQHRPRQGVVVKMTIPAKHSRFRARAARIYLPPAWFAKPRPRLPVVLLLHGVPGGPADWIDLGDAESTLDHWSASHRGLAPIVVMPDINGSTKADTECVDGPRGKAETYLTVDVPDFVRSRLQTAAPGRDWAVAGLSEGGMCATMLALRHPRLFDTFADLSGLVGPRSGDTNDPAGTVAALFGGDQRAFTEHEPRWLLAHHRYPGMAGLFEVGGTDHWPLVAARELAPLAHRAGIGTRLVIVPGAGHTWRLWRRALVDDLPWLDHRVFRRPPRPAVSRRHLRDRRTPGASGDLHAVARARPT